jgi:tetratricopeptide (TPR) repeat protein
LRNDVDIAGWEEELKSARRLKDVRGEWSALRQLGLACQKNRKLTQAASYLTQALALVKTAGEPEDKASATASLGCVYWEMAQLKKAMTLFQEALKLQRMTEDGVGQAVVLVLMGMSHWRKCEWEEGLSYFRQALALQATHELKPWGQPDDETYASLFEALERAVQTLHNRVRLGRDQKNPLKILQPLFSMIPLYLFTGRENEVEALLEEAASLATELGKKEFLDTIPKLDALIKE